MPFSVPTLTEIEERVAIDIRSRLGLSYILRRSWVFAIVKVIAGVSHLMHRLIEWSLRQIFPQTAELEYLELEASLYSIFRKAPDFASGTVEATSTGPIWIPEGATMSSAAGDLYECTTATNVNGTDSVPIRSVEPGTDFDLETADVLTITSSIGGLDPSLVVESPGVTGGSLAETDELLRARLLERRAETPMGGAAFDYVVWAKSVAGITRAWALPEHSGAGTVGVAVATDDAVGGPIPSAPDVAAVQAYIDTVKPLLADTTVFAPTEVTLDANVTLNPNTAEVQTTVDASLTDYLRRNSGPGATLYLSQINEAISQAAGEVDHTITLLNGLTPANVVLANTELATLGTSVWA
jgi:uncharacterized phage protein gp47/JayE